MTDLVIVENFRALFYTPFYLAIGACAAEGVPVKLLSSPSPAAAGAMLQSGEADVMWGGPLRVLLQHEADPACDVQCFCPVVCRDPFFIIGREPRPGFDFSALSGIRLATVAEVPTPWLCLQDDLRRAGLDPAALDRRADLPMADSAQALLDGEFDAVQVFQPHAEILIRAGCHIWYAAATRGPTAYTTLVARHHMLARRRTELQALSRGMAKTLRWIAATPGAQIAPALGEYFPDLAADVVAACIDRYRALNLWSDDRATLREGFDRLRSAMISGGAIAKGAEFEDCCADLR